MRLWFLLLAAALLSSFGCAGDGKRPYIWAAQHPSLRQPPEPYGLGADDQIAVFVTGHEELSATHVISADGQYVQPLLGTITVKGLSTSEVERRLTKRLAVYIKDPRVAVTLLVARKFRVTTLGEVRTPGQFMVSADESVLDLLGRSGGLTDFADDTAIYVVRRGSDERVRFRYEDLTRPDATLRFRLQDGDSIIVQ